MSSLQILPKVCFKPFVTALLQITHLQNHKKSARNLLHCQKSPHENQYQTLIGIKGRACKVKFRGLECLTGSSKIGIDCDDFWAFEAVLFSKLLLSRLGCLGPQKKWGMKQGLDWKNVRPDTAEKRMKVYTYECFKEALHYLYEKFSLKVHRNSDHGGRLSKQCHFS